MLILIVSCGCFGGFCVGLVMRFVGLLVAGCCFIASVVWLVGLVRVRSVFAEFAGFLGLPLGIISVWVL